MKTTIPLAFVVTLFMFTASSCKDEKACRCLIESNALDAPPVLFEIQYVKEDEECSDLNDVSRVYAQGQVPNDTVNTGFVETVITCTDRIESEDD